MTALRSFAVAVLLAGFLAGCGSPADPSGAAATSAAPPVTTGGGVPSASSGSGTGIGSGAGTTRGAGGGSGATAPPAGRGPTPPPGSPPECTEIADTAGLHSIGADLDGLSATATAAAAAAALHHDADQARAVAEHTTGTLRTRLLALAAAVDGVANGGMDDNGALIAFAVALRNAVETVESTCHITVG